MTRTTPTRGPDSPASNAQAALAGLPLPVVLIGEDGTILEANAAAESMVFPISGYDDMNVDEISTQLNDLSTDELQLVRDYEERNKNRDSLLEQMDRKIRAE